MNKTAVIISNPFGYGPTGTAMGFLEMFKGLWEGDIIYAGSGLTKELLENKQQSKIQIVHVDQRDTAALTTLFSSISNPFIISFQNRFAITVAKNLGIPVALVDILGWFWKEAPVEYASADYYYHIRLPFVNDLVPENSHSTAIGATLGKLPEATKKRAHTIVHLGGIKNPLMDELPYDYFNLLAESLNNVSSDIFVLGGNDAIEYLKTEIHNDKVKAISLPRNDFLNLLNEASHFITTAGITATFEAFAMNIPTSFLMPTNLSQWALEKYVSDFDKNMNHLMWEDFTDVRDDLTELTERECLEYFAQIEKEVYSDLTTRERIVKRISTILFSPQSNRRQQELVRLVGINGTEVIVKDILEKWQ